MEFPLSEQKAVEVMKKRGYEQVSHNESGGKITTINFVKRFDNITLHASVYLNKESLSLFFVELKHCCQLSAQNFSFNHKDFEKIEQIVCMYAAKCLDIDVFKTLDELKGTSSPVEEETPKETKTKKDIKQRKREFWDEMMPIAKQRKWSKEQALKFYDYWTEETPGGKRFRRENESYFDINKRMATFDRFDKDRSLKNKTYQERTADKQNEQTKQSKIIDKNKLF